MKELANSEQVKALIEAAARGGDVEISALAIRMNRPVREVERIVGRHREQMLAKAPPTTRLQSYLDAVHDMIDIAKSAYETEALPENASALATLVKTAQDLMSDLEGRQDLTVLSNDVLGALQHCVHQHVGALTNERDTLVNRLKDMRARSEISSSTFSTLERMTSDLLEGFGQRSAHLYRQTEGEIRALMGLGGDNVVQLRTVEGNE